MTMNVYARNHRIYFPYTQLKPNPPLHYPSSPSSSSSLSSPPSSSSSSPSSSLSRSIQSPSLPNKNGTPLTLRPGQLTLTKNSLHPLTSINDPSTLISHSINQTTHQSSHWARSLTFSSSSLGMAAMMRQESSQVAVSCGGRLDDMMKGKTGQERSRERMCEKRWAGMEVLKERRQSRYVKEKVFVE